MELTDAQVALLDAAEALIAEHGSDQVSMRDIAKRAGQRNNSAVSYHFGGRDGLLQAIFGRRMALINVRRTELVAELDAEGRPDDLRGLVEAVLVPLVEHIRQAGPGSRWATFMTRVLPRLDPESTTSALHRDLGARTLAHLRHLPPAVAQERLRLALTMAVAALAAWEQSADETGGGAEEALTALEAHLVDMTVGALLAPVGAGATVDHRTRM